MMTDPPSPGRYGSIEENNLFARQNSLATCAYYGSLSGNSQSPLVCPTGHGCAWFDTYRYLACCSTTGGGGFATANEVCTDASACIGYNSKYYTYQGSTVAVTTGLNVLW